MVGGETQLNWGKNWWKNLNSIQATEIFPLLLISSQWTKYVKPLFEYLQRNTIFWYSNISKFSIFNPLHLPHIGHNNLLRNFDCPGAQWPDISQHFWSNSQFLQFNIFFNVLFHLFHFLWLRKALTFIRLQNLSFPQIFHRLQSIETEKNNMEVAKLILRMCASVKVFYYWKWYEFSKILNVTYKKYQIWLLSNKSPASMCDKVYYMSVCGWACLPSRSLLRVTHKSKNPLSVPQPTTNYNLTKETFQGLNGLSSTKYIYMEMSMILSILFCIFHLFLVINVLTFYQLCKYVIAWLCLAAIP